MKKVVRLSESDLVRLVRRVIKEEGEEREFLSENKCEDLFKTMEFIYKDFESYIHMNFSDESDEQEAMEIYDDFQSEASGLLQVAEELECEELDDLEHDYNYYSNMILDLLGLN
jgi:hypothetical protein